MHLKISVSPILWYWAPKEAAVGKQQATAAIESALGEGDIHLLFLGKGARMSTGLLRSASEILRHRLKASVSGHVV